MFPKCGDKNADLS